MAEDDYYAILEIDRSATSDEVKRAYRKQALRWHPDKNPDNKEEAEERFKKIAEAYEVLSDENKKATYDRFGKRGLNNSGPEFSDEDAAYGFDGSQFLFTGAGPRSRRAHNFMFTDPFEIFRQVFGDDPFMPMDSAFFNGASNRSGSSHRHRNGHNIGTMQTFGFPGFGFPSMSLFGDDPFGGFGGNVQVQSFSSLGGFGGGGSFRSVSSSTRIVNGKQVTTSRIVENGIERVEVKENGELKSVKVNGVEQMVDYRPQQPQRAQTHVHAHSHAHPQHNGYAHYSHPQGHAQDPRASGSASASARRSAHGGSASHSRVDSNERHNEMRSTSSQYDRNADAQPQLSSSKPRKANAKKANLNQ